MTELQFVVLVAVGDDVGVVAEPAAGHADVERRCGGAGGDDRVPGVDGPSLCAGDRRRVGEHGVVRQVLRA